MEPVLRDTADGDAGFCRDCGSDAPATGTRCGNCGSPRLIRHPELGALSTAHVDCDAFYATIEKRDRPELADKPVIVGGGQRGVVLTACYIARTYGVHSAMPMFEARRLCPAAAVVRPDMSKYAEVAGEVRRLMGDLTPLVEPVSIDEAFMDLAGTQRLHGVSAARALAIFAARVEREIGITVSIGLSCNKFLAKVASDLDKPRGFKVLGRAEAAAFLAPRPVTQIFGVGKAAQTKLARAGIVTVGDLQRHGEADLARRFGAEGLRLSRLSHGIDERKVRSDRDARSISAETTFDADIADLRSLERTLWRLAERVSSRLKAKDLAAGTVTLKLKTTSFQTRTRSQSFERPVQLASRLFETARDLLKREADGTRFRLIGLGTSGLEAAGGTGDLLDHRNAEAEHAMDRLRARFGGHAVFKGLSLEDRAKPKEQPSPGRKKPPA